MTTRDADARRRPDLARTTPREGTTTDAAPEGTVVAGRYRLDEALGSGGAGVVHAATDLVTGGRVAVKLLHGGASSASPRVRREVAALRLLQIPGVVALLDEGVYGATPFFAMELVHGRPFPGAERPAWHELAPSVFSLLETLARVHAAGVVHRDLKPANVLVGPDGRVTVLDFGVSWGPALGASVTAVGTVVGTPEYLAPEQILGRGADPRSDLYAVGVMLYEALAGHLPHQALEFHRLVELKRGTAPAPVRSAAPGLPRNVAETVDRLLAVDPLDRPQSAGETSRLLFGSAPAECMASSLPRLGDSALLARIVSDASAGRSLDIWGPMGSGRTRLLTDVADRLEAAGRRVRWVLPSDTPYGSFAPLLGGFEDLRDASRGEAEAAIGSRLTGLLRNGMVLIADDAHRIDAWSAGVLDRSRAEGSIVRAFEHATPGAVEVPALTEEDLRPIFAGPDRIFHLREDGARELWRRTGGLPGLVAAEIAAWVRAGIVQRKDGVVVIRRDALDRFRGGLSVGDELLLRPGPRARSEKLDELLAWIALAWPHSTLDLVARASGEPRWRLDPEVDALAESGLVRRLADGRVQPLVMAHALEVWDDDKRRAAHHALAAALPQGTPLRLRHLASAAESGEVVHEALVIAAGLVRQGRAGDAQMVLNQALDALRSGGSAASAAAVLTAFAWACVTEGTLTAVERALYELGRASAQSKDRVRVEELLHGAKEAISGDAKRALRVLGRMPPFEDGELELQRHALRFRASQRLPIEAQERLLQELERWAAASAHPRAAANMASWRALHLLRAGRCAEAARLHLQAAQSTESAAATAASYVNAALTYLEIGNLTEARDAAASAREAAYACRRAGYEAWALVVLRAVDYRMAATTTCDAELADLAASLGDPHLGAMAYLTEAAVAWRAGDLAAARDLAGRAAERWRAAGERPSEIVARTLQIAAGAEADDDEVAAIVRDTAEIESDDVAAEALGLLAIARPDGAETLRTQAAERVRRAAPANPAYRWPVLSPVEAIQGV